MKKLLVFLIALFCFVSCSAVYTASYDSNFVYVKVFQTLDKNNALCFQVNSSGDYINYTVIKFQTTRFLLYDGAVYKLWVNNLIRNKTYSYTTVEGIYKTVPVWEYY